jgi:hypothetical protein
MPMRLLDIHARTKFLLLVAFMVTCIASLSAIPVLHPWGADMQNIHCFQQCVHGRSPYVVDAKACGDLWARPFYYPPFLFAFFRWVRPLSLDTTMRIWTAFLLGAFVGIFAAWTKHIAPARPEGERIEGAHVDGDGYQIVLFCGLLLLQFPFVFALERGNTDTVNVLLYTVSAFFFVRRRVLLAGVAAGLAAGFKLSPAMAIVVMTGALMLRREGAARWDWLRFGGGALGAFALTLLVFFGEAKRYLVDVLPNYAEMITPAREWGHSIPNFVGGSYGGFGLLLGACLVAVWVWAGARALARGDAALAFAGSLAVSTYLPRTSFDYNLISVYPLLLLLFLRAQRTNRWALLAFGVFAIAGDRRLFIIPGAKVFTPQLHLALQLAFLVVAAVITARPDPGETAPAPTA